MRPLTGDVGADPAASTGAVLVGAHGQYCAICERPMPAELWLLDTTTGALLDADTPGAAGTSVVVCHDCGAEHVRRGSGLDGLALPHRDATFSLDEESPFQYALEPATVVQVGPRGSPHSEPEPRDLVFVTGTTPAAQATVEHFALNTSYLDASSRVLTIPWAHHSPDLDRRVFLRTDVWRRATAFAATLAGTADTAVLEEMGRDLAEATGFWSTFASALHAATRDRELVNRVLLWSVQSAAGGLARFPGTRTDRL